MKNRANVVLLVLFFTGLFGLWLAQYTKLPTRKDLARLEPRVLPELIDTKPDDVRRIEISGGSSKLAFERRDDIRWQMTEPVDTAADATMVEALAFTLKELTKQRDVGHPDGPLGSFGLETPTRTVTVFGPDKSRPIATLDVGNITQGMRYVRDRSSKFVDVVDAKPLAAVDLPPIRWRALTLVPISSHLVNSMEVTGQGRSLVVEREGDVWHITKPIKALGDGNAVDGTIAEVIAVKVADGEKGFVADDVKDFAKYGLDKPSATFTLVSTRAGKSETQVFHLGKPVEGVTDGSRVYARRGDQDEVVVVDASRIRNIGVNPLDLHSKKLTDFKPRYVNYFRLKTANSTVAVARGGEEWMRVEPLKDKADKAAVEDLLKKLDEAEAVTIFPEGSAPDPQLDKPWAVVELWHNASFDNQGNPTTPPRVTIKVGRRDALNKFALCQAEGDKAVLSVPLAFVKEIPQGPLGLRDRLIAAVPGPELARVDIKIGDKARSLMAPEKPDPNGWQLVEPFNGPADTEAVGRLILTLSNLRADSLIADKVDDKFKPLLDAPHIIATWTTRPKFLEPPRLPIDPTTTTLIVGKPLPDKSGKRYAKISTSPILFTLPPEVVAVFDVEWHDRKVLAFDPAKLEKIVIGWPEIALAFRPVADASSKTKEPQWVAIDPPAGLNFDVSRVKALVKALSRLQTFRFVQYSGPIQPADRLFPPRLRIDLHSNDGTMTRVSLGSQTSDGYLLGTLSLDKTGAVFQLPLSLWQPWLSPPKLAAPGAKKPPDQAK